MKIKQTLSLFLSFLLLASILPFASAGNSAGNIAVFSYWIDSDQTDLTVMQGATPQFAVVADSYESPIDITVELVQGDKVIRTLLEDTNVPTTEYYELMSLYTANLEGDYEIITTATTNSDVDITFLNLTVQANPANNHQPVINSAPEHEVDENQEFTYVLDASDADNDTLTYALTQKPSWITGLQLDNNHFKISGTAPELTNDYNFVVTAQVSDGQSFATQTFVITVKDTDADQSDEPESVAIFLAWTDVDTPTHTIEFGESAQFIFAAESVREDSMTVEIDLRRNGVLMENLVEEYTTTEDLTGSHVLDSELRTPGTYQVEATVTGASGSQDTANLSLVVPDVCSPAIEPIADQSTAEMNLMTVRISTHDCDSNTQLNAQVAPDVLTDAQTIALNNNRDGTWDFAFEAPNTFVTHQQAQRTFEVTLTATDGDARTPDAVDRFLVTITDDNVPPRITSTPVTVGTVGQLYTYTVTATDDDPEDQNNLIFSLPTRPAGMTMDLNGAIQWTPATAGTFDVTAQVADPLGATATQPYTIVVDEAQNEIPTAFDQTVQTDEETPVSITLTGNDPDGTIVAYTVASLPADGTLTGSAPTLVYTPRTNFSGQDSFTFTVTDNDGTTSAPATVTINVRGENDAPTLNIPNFTVNEDQGTFQIDLHDYADDQEDADDQLVFGFTGQTDTTAVTCGLTTDGHTLNCQTQLDQTGSNTITIIVWDTAGASAQDSFTITVIPTTDAPVLAPIGDQTVQEGQTLTFTVTAIDPDNDPLTYSVDNTPRGASFSNQVFTWTPDFSQAGIYTMTFTVSDGTYTDQETIRITVTEGNSGPMIVSSPSRLATQDELYTYQVEVLDLDNDGYTLELVYGPEGMRLDAHGLITWTPERHGSFCAMIKATENTPEQLSDEQAWCIDTRDVTRALKVNNVNLLDEFVSAGDDLRVFIDIDNEGDEDLENVRISAVLYDLGIRRTVGPFDLDSGDDTHKQLILEIPRYAAAGEYDLRVVVGNDDISRVTHRIIEIVE